MSTKKLSIIGSTALVEIAGISRVPAKIDTGADSSSIWASSIMVTPEQTLEFCLFSPISSLYTGEVIQSKSFTVQRVRSSTGEVTVRYRVRLSMKVAGRRIRTSFTLADRTTNNFPILIGRKTLRNRFLVDVAKVGAPRPPKMNNDDIIAAFAANPEKFHTDLYREYKKSKKR